MITRILDRCGMKIELHIFVFCFYTWHSPLCVFSLEFYSQMHICMCMTQWIGLVFSLGYSYPGILSCVNAMTEAKIDKETQLFEHKILNTRKFMYLHSSLLRCKTLYFYIEGIVPTSWARRCVNLQLQLHGQTNFNLFIL